MNGVVPTERRREYRGSLETDGVRFLKLIRGEDIGLDLILLDPAKGRAIHAVRQPGHPTLAIEASALASPRHVDGLARVKYDVTSHRLPDELSLQADIVPVLKIWAEASVVAREALALVSQHFQPN